MDTENVRPGQESTTTLQQQATTTTTTTTTPTERTPLVTNGSVGFYHGVGHPSSTPGKSRGSDVLGKIVFWLLFTSIIAPIMLFICLVCWFLVITVPMAKLNWALLKHMFDSPYQIRFCAAPPVPPRHVTREHSAEDGFEATTTTTTQPDLTPFKPARLSAGQIAPYGSPSSKVLLCTYHAIGLRYYKYTVGGVNIFFVNLLAVVFFVIFDGLVLLPWRDSFDDRGIPVPVPLEVLTNRALIFLLSLASVIPLSYFIGMAVASISAQSSIGMGAVINATFGSIIEIILYAIALTQGKGPLVEGSIVGSLLAGVLLMPGASMCSGALYKKEQKFNAKSAGVTSTMLIMAFIGTLTPTLFYQTYGNVRPCPTLSLSFDADTVTSAFSLN